MATTVTTLIVTIKQGEVFDIPFTITNDGSPTDLQGAEITFEVKKTPVVTSTPIVSKTITETSDINTIGQITFPESGKWQVHLDSIDTSFAPYDYYLVITLKLNGQEDIISSVACNKAIYRICTQ